ncbi:Helitron helicase-like domain-containing protein [Strongyloides ratti]|uniref:Helitron helicase-like domain-containing protein n=1 Tax=Strongyloides ratti TaxID=34506 RepID=A0A090KVL9_STRRB|nr:Helitron helicase-like domain-containing protein [Strongyloides ratti]CEF61555.1 Helitron helicase-like domain-containing protein [Strongyloides ratti]
MRRNNNENIFNPDAERETSARILKSLTGGPKWYKFKKQNALAVQRHFGKPHLFITFTCNPKWPEIINSLPEGFKSTGRPDIVIRVFSLKLMELITMLRHGLFGEEEYLFYSVEVQKRGLPHAHILLRIKEFEKNTSTIDKIIYAEISDSKHDKALYDIAVKNMLHQNCNEMKEKSTRWNLSKNKCSKNFPKKFVKETYIDKISGKVHYKRRDNRNENIILLDNRKIDNSYVVPYNPTLLRYFNAHINVEIVNQVLAVSYLFKYFVKDGETNKVNVEMLYNDNNKDEVSAYQKVRCVGPTDATWKIFEYPIVCNTVTVEVLYIHEKPKNENSRIYLNYLNEDNDFLYGADINNDTDALIHLMTV